MANKITNQTIIDGSRNLVVKVQISGDNSNDEVATKLIDMSAYANANCGGIASLKIMKIDGVLNGFSAQLLWDANTNVKAVDITAGDVGLDFSKYGGLVNNAGAGVTGDIMLTTTGLAMEEGSLILEMVKKY